MELADIDEVYHCINCKPGQLLFCRLYRRSTVTLSGLSTGLSALSSPPVSPQLRLIFRRESSDEAKLRRNKAFTAIKQELADREKQKRKAAKERAKRGKKNPVRDQVKNDEI